MSFSELDPLKIVIDTNVFVSGGTVATGYPSKVVELWRDDQISLVTSPALLDELKYVLARPVMESFGWTPAGIDRFLEDLRANSRSVAGITSVKICRDPDDNALFAAAIEGDAPYIVSGDKDVLAVEEYQGISTLTPRDFIEWFQMQRLEEAA